MADNWEIAAIEAEIAKATKKAAEAEAARRQAAAEAAEAASAAEAAEAEARAASAAAREAAREESQADIPHAGSEAPSPQPAKWRAVGQTNRKKALSLSVCDLALLEDCPICFENKADIEMLPCRHSTCAAPAKAVV